MTIEATDWVPFGTGALFGFIVLLPFLKSSVRVLSENGFLALAMMLMIYAGAHLVTSALNRILLEAVLASVILIVARVVRSVWPVGIGVLILFHGAYDFLLGHDAGVAPWYPLLCVGFDVVVGIALMVLIAKRNTQESNSA